MLWLLAKSIHSGKSVTPGTCGQGFMTQGRGIVVCNVMMSTARYANVEAVDWRSDIVYYTVRFVPASHVSAYLQSFSLEAILN